MTDIPIIMDAARDWFSDLWEDLHGVESWKSNPECVALTFTVRRINIDGMPREQARLGLVHLWYRGLGLTLPFYGLTDRGRQLAAALLCPRPKPRRTIIGANHGEGNVSSR